MTERVESVRLLANVTNYIAGLERARIQTARLADSSSTKLAATRLAFEQTGRGLIAFGAVAAAAVFLAVKAFADFDRAMSQVSASSGATGADLDDLAQAAIENGRAFGFSAVAAAGAEEALAKAGVTTAQIMGGALRGALTLAAAGQYDVAESADLAAIAMKQFGLQGEDIPHVADLIAAAAGKAVGDVSDIADALRQSGLVAHQFGLSIEDTTGTLAAFADAGLLGSDSGTSFKQMLLSLAAPSGKAGKLLHDLKIEAYDASGQFIGITGLAGLLREKLGGLSQEARQSALSIIFGSDAIRAATVLYDQGSAGIQGYIDRTNDAGYAARQAAVRLDNLSGDVGKLGAAFTKDIIESGSAANDILRGLVQSTTGLLDVLGGAPAPIVALTSVVSLLALAGGGALLASAKMAQFRVSLDTLGISGRVAAARIGLTAGAITAATLVIGYFVARQAEAAATTQEFQDSLDQTTGALTDYSRELIKKKLAEGGVFDAAKEAGIGQRELTDAVLEGGDALAEVNRKLTGNNTFATFFTGVGIRAGNAQDALHIITNGLKDAKKNFDDVEAAGDGAASTTDANSAALAELTGSASAADESISGLADTIRGFASATLDVREAERGLQEAIDSAAQSVADNAATLDTNTEAGRRNEESLDALAKSSIALAAARYDETGSAEDAAAAIQAGRDALISQLGAYDITGQAAEDYADNLGLIPANIATLIDLNTTDAERKLAALRASLAAFKLSGQNLVAYIRSVDGKASGGLISGPGSGTSDTAGIYALSNGEFVNTARAASNPLNRAAMEYMNAGGVIRRYASGGLAGEGQSRLVRTAPMEVALARGSYGSAQERPNVNVDMMVVTDDPYAAGELVKQGLAAKLVGL